MALPPKQLGELKTFVNLIRAKPEILQSPDLKFFKDYLESLGARIPEPKHEPKPEPEPEPKVKEEPKPEPKSPEPELEPDTDLWVSDKFDLPMGDSSKTPSEDEENEANDLYSKGRKASREKDTEAAFKYFSDAIVKNPQSAVLFASRGEVSLAMKKPNAAIYDADRSLSLNPDSAKAYKVRGTARRHLGIYEDAIKDLYQGNKLDWDETTDSLIKSIKGRVDKIVEARKKAEHAAKERELEERKRKAAEQRRQQQEEEDRRRRQEEMPGMPGMSGMNPDFMNIFNDPDIQAAMNDATVMQQVKECATDPAKLEQYAKTNPKLRKIVEKLGPMMSMFGGAGGSPTGAPAGSEDAGEELADDLD